MSRFLRSPLTRSLLTIATAHGICLCADLWRCSGDYLRILTKKPWKFLPHFFDFQLPRDLLRARAEAHGSNTLFIFTRGTWTQHASSSPKEHGPNRFLFSPKEHGSDTLFIFSRGTRTEHDLSSPEAHGPNTLYLHPRNTDRTRFFFTRGTRVQHALSSPEAHGYNTLIICNRGTRRSVRYSCQIKYSAELTGVEPGSNHIPPLCSTLSGACQVDRPSTISSPVTVTTISPRLKYQK